MKYVHYIWIKRQRNLNPIKGKLIAVNFISREFKFIYFANFVLIDILFQIIYILWCMINDFRHVYGILNLICELCKVLCNKYQSIKLHSLN